MLIANSKDPFALFNDIFSLGTRALSQESQHVAHAMNISESDSDYQIEIQIPGIKKEELDICIDHNNTLNISVSTEKSDTQSTERRYIRREFERHMYKQSFTLPEDIKKEQITAQATDGILYINIPKMQEEEQYALSQKIEIA